MSDIDYEGTYTSRVNADDLCSAEPGNPWNCAIARAVKREHPEIEYIRVGHGTISFTDRDSRLRITVRTSLRAQDAQEKLDAGVPVEAEDFPPIRFHMDEAKIEPIEFNERERERQNRRRAEVREGRRIVRPMSEAEKQKRRSGRRHA